MQKSILPSWTSIRGWKILKNICIALKKDKLFNSFNTLREEVLNSIINFTKINNLPKYKSPQKKTNNNFIDEKIYINQIDYYFSNAISRASKVMSECRSIKLNTLKSGTNN